MKLPLVSRVLSHIIGIKGQLNSRTRSLETAERTNLFQAYASSGRTNNRASPFGRIDEGPHPRTSIILRESDSSHDSGSRTR